MKNTIEFLKALYKENYSNYYQESTEELIRSWQSYSAKDITDVINDYGLLVEIKTSINNQRQMMWNTDIMYGGCGVDPEDEQPMIQDMLIIGKLLDNLLIGKKLIKVNYSDHHSLIIKYRSEEELGEQTEELDFQYQDGVYSEEEWKNDEVISTYINTDQEIILDALSYTDKNFFTEV